ncbi:MAG: hypothetical protein JXQ84_06150, partial [Rhodospirillaceae bacterium]|nr:hypothetical protein [Rhodospirillaceae bacterium]
MSAVLRVCRTEATRYAALSASGESLYARYADLNAVLQAALPETTAMVFAAPVVSADGSWIDWTTVLPGQPVPLSSLSGEARARVEALLRERLDAIRALAARLPDAGRADVLKRAAVDPGVDQVFVSNGQPVIVGWGQEGHFASAPLPRPVSSPGSVVSPAGAVPPVGAVVSRRSWWRWILAVVLALVVIAAVLLLLRRCAEDILPPAAETPPPVAVDPLDADDLRAKILAAEAEIRRRLSECPVPDARPVLPDAEPPQDVPQAEAPQVEPPQAVPP